MVRYLFGRDESFPLVSHMCVLKLPRLEMFYSAHDMHLAALIPLFILHNKYIM